MVAAPVSADDNLRASHVAGAKFSSYLPEVYAGHPNRIQRYYEYENMNRDSDINAALDTIADFCTQSEEQTDNPFTIHYNEEATETEVTLIKGAMTKWVRLNDFKRRLWKIIRDTAMNGDAFFLRDPETAEWLWLDHFSVEMVRVDDEDGKKADEYIVRNLSYSRQGKFATSPADVTQYRTPFGTPTIGAAPARPVAATGQFSMAGGERDPRAMRYGQISGQNDLHVIDAEHVVHLSLSANMDINWPFGNSILDPIYKVYRQKELLEDSVIIYRVQRAPERRVFYIDCGNMNPVKAESHVEAIKNKIHQRRIPNRTGGGASVIDAAYNPLSMLDDYFFAQTADGRGSKVEVLPGGEMVGEIGDLLHFSRKMARGLRIPTSYLALGGDEDSGGGASYNDGKLGAAMIQEYRFTKYCMRIQAMLAPVFDAEFKRFMKDSGIELDWGLFELQFLPPQQFTEYRQIEVDAQRVSLYSQVADQKDMSRRFIRKKYLGWTEEDILENERLWKEENAERLRRKLGSTPAESEPSGDLSSVGVRPTTGDDFGETSADMDLSADSDMPGGEGGDGGMPPAPGGSGPMPAPPPPGGGTPA